MPTFNPAVTEKPSSSAIKMIALKRELARFGVVPNSHQMLSARKRFDEGQSVREVIADMWPMQDRKL